MGDMADDLIAQSIDMDVAGVLDPKPQIPQRTSCKYCGQTGLHWKLFYVEQHDKMIWRLVDIKDEQHTCKEYRDAQSSV